MLWTLDHLGQSGEAPYLKGLKQLSMLAFLVAMAAIPAVALRRSTDPRRELWRWETGLSLGLVLATAAALAQAIHFYAQDDGLGRVLGWLASNPSIAAGSDELYLGHRFVGIPRLSGPTCEPLYFGSYLLVAVPVAVAGAWSRRGWSRRWRGLAAAVGAVCLVMTFSRGVYLAACVLIAGLSWGVRRRRLGLRCTRRGLVLAAAGLGLVTVAVASLAGLAPWEVPTLLLRRVAQSFATHDMSNLTRWMSWRGAWQAFETHPWLGVGWGGYGFWYYRLVPEGAGAHFGWPVTNNLPLRLLAETGWVGLASWAVALRPAVRSLWRRDVPIAGDGASWGDGAAFFLACVVVALGVQMLTFSQIQLPHLWLVAGTSAAVGREAHRLV
jgi:O-antigen ligase